MSDLHNCKILKIVGTRYRKEFWDAMWNRCEAWGYDLSKPEFVCNAWLVREPENRHDHNAIRVEVRFSRVRVTRGGPRKDIRVYNLGYISQDFNEPIAKLMDQRQDTELKVPARLETRRLSGRVLYLILPT